jgi:arylsulfatase A-like enzyme
MTKNSQSTTPARISRRALLAGAAALPGTSQKRPNVLFILVDEWRTQATGYNGDPNVHAPVLDRFERESVNFQNAVSGDPVCCAYRGSLMTGQFPLRNGVFINDMELKPNGVTLGEAFKQAGYRTGYIGKWHLYGSPDGKYGRRQAYVPPGKRFGFEYWKAFECSHNYNQSPYYEGNDETMKYWDGYDAIAQTNDACSFIERQAKSAEPYFLALSLGPPHPPYATAPEKYQAMFRDREIQLRPNVPPEKRKEATEILRGYYAHIAALDDCLATLLATLERTGASDNTVVVFTSDHGDMILSQGLTTKLYPWEESIRVPFLLRYPAKYGRKGRRLNTPINAPDIMPTLLGVCGLPVPGSVDGSDFSKLAAGAPERPDASALLSVAVPTTELRKHGFAEYRGLRTTRYTYARSIQGPWLLYDNERDPYQKKNLCGKSEAKQIQAKLERDLTTRLRELKDDFLPAAEYVRRAGVGHYREVNVPVGHARSPWGDWESTLTAANGEVPARP